jgi:hypothetical protein
MCVKMVSQCCHELGMLSILSTILTFVLLLTFCCCLPAFLCVAVIRVS